MTIDWQSGTVKLWGVAGVLGTLMVAAFLNLSNQTAVAIEVAKQHGHELLLVRQEVAELRGTVLVNMDDRFRREDFEREKQFLIHRIEEVEGKVERLEDK